MQINEPLNFGVTNPASTAGLANVSQESLNNHLLKAIKTGLLADVNQAIAAGADVNAVDEAGFSAAMLAAAHGDIEKLDALNQSGAHLNALHSSGANVASLAASNGHLSTMNYALSNGADITHIDLAKVADVACRQSIIKRSINAESLVNIKDHEDKILKIIDPEDPMMQMRPMNGLERIASLISRAAMHPVTKARISTWKKDRHEYTLKHAMELTQKHENNLAEYMKTGEMANIMSDINALGNTPNDIEYALKNSNIGKNLNIKNRLESLQQETLMAFDREGRNVESAWKDAIKSNSAAGNDISAIATESMTKLSKVVETMPTKIKNNGDVEFMGDKIKEQMDGLIQMAINLGKAISRLFAKKVAP